MFEAITKNSGELKNIFETLFQNVTSITLFFTETGISLEHLTNQNILLYFIFPKKHFDEYIFTSDEEKFSVILENFINKEFFKSIKSKDTISMYKNGFRFEFIKKKEGSKKEEQKLSFNMNNSNTICNKNFNFKYSDDPFLIKKQSFIQLNKSLNTSYLEVVKMKNKLIFYFNTGRSEKYFTIYNDNYVNDEENNVEHFRKKFTSEQFLRLSKISSFIFSNIYVYFEEDKPLYLSCWCNLGNINIYLYDYNNE
jgi:hypothetical protein